MPAARDPFGASAYNPPMRRTVAAAVLGVAALLGGCDRPPPTSVFARVDGAWQYAGIPIRVADPATFTPLDDHHARDRERVYYVDTYRDGREYFTVKHVRIAPVQGADPATFQLVRHGYARDARNVYYDGVRMPVRDAATFEPIEVPFARDRLAGYYYQAEIAGSEGGAAFVAIDAHHAKDSRRVYYGDVVGQDGRAVPVVTVLDAADPRSFKVLERGYAADAGRVWFNGKRVEAADAGTFAPLPTSPDAPDAEDVRATYVRGERRPK